MQLQKIAMAAIVGILVGVAVPLLSHLTASSSGNDGPSTPAMHVLFIGNSYIFVNDLPNTFAALARAGNHPVSTDMAAVGGATLQQHLGMSQTRNKLAAERWDYVVLQEQSVIPAIPSLRKAQMYPAVRQFAQIIRAQGAQPVLLLTWGRRDGLREAGYRDYQTMQAQLTTGYMTIADELNVCVAPAGVAWQTAAAQKAGMALWQADGSHPSDRGSYLAACIVYATLFRESPVGLPPSTGLSVEAARGLQIIARDTVLTDRAHWHIRKQHLAAPATPLSK
jgi:hypothetical protein